MTVLSLLFAIASVIGWNVSFKHEESSGFVTDEQKDYLIVYNVVVTFLTATATIYGLIDLDSGWLMVGTIGQIALTSTMHFGYGGLFVDNSTNYRFCALIFVFGTLGAYCNHRTLESSQEDT